MSLGPGSDHSPGLRLGSLLLCEAADRPVRGAGRAALRGSAAATAVVLGQKYGLEILGVFLQVSDVVDFLKFHYFGNLEDVFFFGGGILKRFDKR